MANKVRFAAVPLIIDTNMMALQPKSDRLDAEFLFYFIAFKELSRIADVSSVPQINNKHINPYPIALPPLPEQRRVAKVLRTWDEAIEKTERLIAAKERRARAVGSRLYAPCMSSSWSLKGIAWTHYTFADLFEEVSEPNAALSAEDVITVGKYAIRRQIEHFNRSVASKDLSSYQILRPGDFVYDPMSAYYGAIGRYNGSAPGIVSPAYRVIRLKPGIEAGFVEGLLKSHYIRFQLEARSSQNNKEGKRRLLQRAEFNAIAFRLPPIEEQNRITEAMQFFSRDVEASRSKLSALHRQKLGLMQKMLTGQWRVPLRDGEVEDMAERVLEEAAE